MSTNSTTLSNPENVVKYSNDYIKACNTCRTTNPNPPKLYEVDKTKINGHIVYFYDEKFPTNQLLYGRVLFLPSRLSRGTNKYRIQIDGQDPADLKTKKYYDVEKIYTDVQELSNNVPVQIRSGGRKSKKVFKNKNKKRKSRKSSKRSRMH